MIGILLGLGSLGLIVYMIYKVSVGEIIGFNDIFFLSTFIMFFFYTITWGS
ncbi:hypothetical protein J2S74_002226 [Evansella vedderi]|uniref:Uncharacterized protein n=1 Tax=Evansella vedderi TaxID=38282 RepID=A0ABT9ZVS4_9BACI|nr:hypothetical protein [Evansella vedderi]